ncbi:MAG: hypothetical protein GF329_05555 [Candidatus Lokiarchaeota archaeon]|nr:hypothetical protein [Candidatus Lokiarchaeota archaeon]
MSLWSWLTLYKIGIIFLISYISNKLGLVKREEKIIKDEKKGIIYFKDKAGMVNWGFFLDLIFSLFLLLFFFIFLDKNIFNFIFLLLIYYSIFIPLMILLSKKLKIKFNFTDEHLIIKKISPLRKIFHLKNRWILELRNLKTVYLDEIDKRKVIFDLNDNKFILKIHYSSEETLESLCSVLNKYIS